MLTFAGPLLTFPFPLLGRCILGIEGSGIGVFDVLGVFDVALLGVWFVLVVVPAFVIFAGVFGIVGCFAIAARYFAGSGTGLCFTGGAIARFGAGAGAFRDILVS